MSTFSSPFLDLRRSRNKQKKYEYSRLFRRGSRFCYILYLLTIAFFVSWFIGHSREQILVLNSDPFSKVFFFLNPKVFRYVFLGGNFLDLLQNASNQDSFIFISCYLACLFLFSLNILFAIWLFLIAYHTSVRGFHYISCLSVFPIIACFPLSWFMVQLMVYQRDTRLKRISRFKHNFVQEEFEDNLGGLDPKYLATRTIMDPFTHKNYRSYFRKDIKQDLLEHAHKKISDFLG